jgi:hypothetical protein
LALEVLISQCLAAMGDEVPPKAVGHPNFVANFGCFGPLGGTILGGDILTHCDKRIYLKTVLFHMAWTPLENASGDQVPTNDKRLKVWQSG